MSLYALQTNLASIKPKVWAVGDHLYARTSYPLQALTLFAYARKLHVDGERKVVEIETDWFWLFNKHREIPFHRVAYIDSSFADWGTSFGWTDNGLGRTDKFDVFRVRLMLKDPPEMVPLFNFAGDGVVKTGATGVLFGGDSLIDSYGDQAEHYGFFMKMLKEYLNVPIGGADYIPIKDPKSGLQYRCSVCKRPSIAGREKCWMCGSPVEPMIPGIDDRDLPQENAEAPEEATVEEPLEQRLGFGLTPNVSPTETADA